MHKCILLLILSSIIFSGCASTRAIESARESITELERIREEQESRNTELEKLIESERASNKELGNLLSGIREENERNTEEERLRIGQKRQFLDRLESIFSRESEITDKLIEINKLLREYFKTHEAME